MATLVEAETVGSSLAVVHRLEVLLVGLPPFGGLRLTVQGKYWRGA